MNYSLHEATQGIPGKDRIIKQMVSENYGGSIRYETAYEGNYLLKIMDKSISHATIMKLRTYGTVIYYATEPKEVIVLHLDLDPENTSWEFHNRNVHIDREIADKEIASMVSSLLKELEKEENAKKVSFKELNSIFLKDKLLTGIYLK